MKVLYVSGKYRDSRGPWYIRKNIELAADVAIELWRMGFCVICPHCNTAFFDGPINDPLILAGDCELVKRADGLVIIAGWETSLGTRTEWKTAWDNNKPIFFWDKDKELLRRWAADDYDIERHITLQRGVNSIEALAKLQFYRKPKAC